MTENSTRVWEGTSLARAIKLGWITIILLLFKNGVGIYLNLFITIPEVTDLLPAMAAIPLLTLHIIIGLVLLGMTGFLLGFYIKSHSARAWIIAVGIVACTALAISSGVEFVIAGQNDTFSFVMELFFLGSVLFNIIIIVTTKPHLEP